MKCLIFASDFSATFIRYQMKDISQSILVASSFVVESSLVISIAVIHYSKNLLLLHAVYMYVKTVNVY